MRIRRRLASPCAYSAPALGSQKDSLERQRLAALLEEQNILLKQRESELREQNVKFETALTNMTQGLAMFDAEQRVIVANERYAKLYGLSLEQVKPGTTLHEILENRVANGIYACATPQEYIKQRLAISDGPSSKILKLSDGRTIANTGRPMPQGGWVTTHEDITERERLKDRLDAALNNMAQGLAMFDAEQRLVLCNGRFAQMYGLLPEQIESGPTVRDILAYCVANGCYAGKIPDNMLASTMKRLGSKSYYTTSLSDGRVYGVSIMPMAGGGIVTTHEDITERQRIEAHIAHLAHHDALTDLPNRVLLRSRLEEALVGATRQGAGVAVLCLDLDGFKDVNDTLGHSVGDLLLKSVADRLRPARVRATSSPDWALTSLPSCRSLQISRRRPRPLPPASSSCSPHPMSSRGICSISGPVSALPFHLATEATPSSS